MHAVDSPSDTFRFQLEPPAQSTQGFHQVPDRAIELLPFVSVTSCVTPLPTFKFVLPAVLIAVGKWRRQAMRYCPPPLSNHVQAYVLGAAAMSRRTAMAQGSHHIVSAMQVEPSANNIRPHPHAHCAGPEQPVTGQLKQLQPAKRRLQTNQIFDLTGKEAHSNLSCLSCGIQEL